MTSLILIIFVILGVLFWRFWVNEAILIPEEAEALKNRQANKEQEAFFETELTDSSNNAEIIQFVYLKSFSDLRDDFLREGRDFLEVNLEKEKVRLYNQGVLIQEMDILTLGEREHWGGSAAGLYRIESGNKLSYSIVSEVYMPHALHYYGKYYLHGEPYYPGGEKLVSDFSGGCIRLSDQDALELYNLVEIGLPVLVVDNERQEYFYENNFASDFPDITANSYLVADLDSGFVLAEKNSNQKRPVASITKLMTAIVLAENVVLTESIAVRPEMLTAYGSIQGLDVGQRFRVIELFYPLLIESSNNVGEILSYFLGRDRTIRLMNNKAPSLLMSDSVFVDPHGLSEGNISTARDVFKILRYTLMNRPPLMEISRGETVRNFGPIKFDLTEMWNKNIFANDPSFIGGKTGFILASRYTGAMAFEFLNQEGDSRRIAIIYLGSENAKSDVQSIYGWITKNFSLVPSY